MFTHHILWYHWCRMSTGGWCWASASGVSWSRTAAAEHIWRAESEWKKEEWVHGSETQRRHSFGYLLLFECTEQSVGVRDGERKRESGPGVRLRDGDLVVAPLSVQPGVDQRVQQLGDQVWRSQGAELWTYGAPDFSSYMSLVHKHTILCCSRPNDCFCSI